MRLSNDPCGDRQKNSKILRCLLTAFALGASTVMAPHAQAFVVYTVDNRPSTLRFSRLIRRGSSPPIRWFPWRI